jgi:hypothetical protein
MALSETANSKLEEDVASDTVLKASDNVQTTLKFLLIHQFIPKHLLPG